MIFAPQMQCGRHSPCGRHLTVWTVELMIQSTQANGGICRSNAVCIVDGAIASLYRSHLQFATAGVRYPADVLGSLPGAEHMFFPEER